MVRSAQHLADHFEDVPLFLFAFTRNDRSGGSIFPAVWSAMLAARGLGIGSALTSVLGALRGAETMAVLGVPRGHGLGQRLLRLFRLSHRSLGNRSPQTRARSHLPQSLGDPVRPGGAGTAVVRGWHHRLTGSAA